MLIDLDAVSRHGQAAISAMPTIALYNGSIIQGSFRTTRTGIMGVDGGTITEIGGSYFVSKRVCLNALGVLPTPETTISVRQLNGSYLPFWIEDVIGAEDATLTEVTLILGPTNR